MKSDLNNLLDFMRFTHEIRQIKRTIHFDQDDEQENDTEHMYQLALVVWFLIENDKLPFDKFRCVGMALVHDVIEVYAGDISAHLPEHEHPDRKKQEEMAIERLKKRWPTFGSLRDLIDEYEELKTPEAKFVYSLDKLLPVLNIYIYEGRSWHIMDISITDINRIKSGKADLSPKVADYYYQTMKLLKRNPELFGTRHG